MKLMTSRIQATNTRSGGTTLQRQDFIAAALRLPDGDPWKEKALKDYPLNAEGAGTEAQQR